MPQLAQAVGTPAVQISTSRIASGGDIDFPASVDFSPQHIIQPDPVNGFPPVAAQPGATGEPGYSPLVQVTFRGTKVVLNAPQIANATGQADKIVSINDEDHVVKYRQGLNAALLDGHSPLNILKEIPERTAQFDYSPLWDIHLVRWNDSVTNRPRQTNFDAAQALVGTQAQSLTPAGLSNTFGATGFIVNCPVVSLDVNPSH